MEINEINAHDKDKENVKLLGEPIRIRAVPKKVSYKNGIIIFDCIDDNGQTIELKANSKPSVIYLHEKNFGLSKEWIEDLKKTDTIYMVSTGKTSNLINWIICKDFIACFVSDNFKFFEISEIINLLKIPSNWNYNIIENKKSLFGGRFELSTEGKRIYVDCGINNGSKNTLKIEIDGKPTDFKPTHVKNGIQKIVEYLNRVMNEVPKMQTIPLSENKLYIYFKQARIELGSNKELFVDDIISKISQIASAKMEQLGDGWEGIIRDKIKNEWATDKPR